MKKYLNDDKELLSNFYIFYIDTLYNMIYNKIIKGAQPNVTKFAFEF